MNKFIFTFGCGQANAGKCQPIFANTMREARAEMEKQYGLKWAFGYTEEDWEACKVQAEEQGYKIETEMVPINAEVAK